MGLVRLPQKTAAVAMGAACGGAHARTWTCAMASSKPRGCGFCTGAMVGMTKGRLGSTQGQGAVVSTTLGGLRGAA